MNLIIEERSPRKAYSKWKQERGLFKIVTPINFLSYVKRNGKIYRFRIDDKLYEGQRWRCKYNNRLHTYTFRVEVNELDLKKKLHREVPEDVPDLISGNKKLLKLQKEKEKNLIERLKKENTSKAKAHIAFLKKPCKETMNDLLRWRTKK